jgi:DNA-binding response OmpR family regulator
VALFFSTLGMLRQRAGVRCAPGSDNLRYLFEDYVLDTDRRELRLGASLLPLAPQVFDILVYLIDNRERVVGKDDLIAAIWHGRNVSESALTTRLNAGPFPSRCSRGGPF